MSGVAEGQAEQRSAAKATPSDRVDAFVLTGFLGSGKTTLLASALADPAFADTAVIVNELGEVGIDHELLSFSSDATLVLPGGCVCCSIREDIEQALRDLFEARDAGRIAPFRRLVIETTGIAEPLPLLATLHQNPLALARLNKPEIVTVLDGVLGEATLGAHREAQEQIVHADKIVISKSDLIEPPARARLADLVAAQNPWATLHEADLTQGAPARIFETTPSQRPEALAERWAAPFEPGQPHSHSHSDVQSFALTLQHPLDWTGFGVFMTLLLHRHGNNVLRVKGLLAVEGLPGPTLFQCAQHLVHPPHHMEAWPSDARTTRLVFIARGLDPATIKKALLAFDHAARVAPERLEHYLPAGGGGSIAGRPVKRPTAPRWIKA